MPEAFRLWTAITILGAVVEQNVWVNMTSRKLYPNLYTFLVGSPGAGKTVTINAGAQFFRDLKEFKQGSTSVTGASLIREMTLAVKFLPDQTPYNSLFLYPDDLQALMSDYKTDLIAALTVFYNTTPFSLSRKTENEQVRIASPQLSLLAGTTPSQLMTLLPDGAWKEGFMSRTIVVQADHSPRRKDMFVGIEQGPKDALLHDINCIYLRRGPIDFTDSVRNEINEWRNSGCLPVPIHPKLEHYNTRRVGHILKLCTISCIDRGADIIDGEDFSRAKSWLFEAETRIPRVFAGALSTDTEVMKELAHEVRALTKVTEQKLNRMILDRGVKSTEAFRFKEMLKETGYVCPVEIDGRTYYMAGKD